MNVEAVLGDGQDAAEVVQDALWTVVRKIDTFRGESAFGSCCMEEERRADIDRGKPWRC
jgi:hypothetical protein